MVSLVMPYRKSRWDDTEIKYCLRSVQAHLTNYGELFIIGDKPKGIKGYVHIPFVDDTRMVYKERNIYLKVMEAVKDERVSDTFLYINDDHFLNSDYDAETFPYYYGDWPVKTDMYAETIANTKNTLLSYNSFASSVVGADLTSPVESFLFYDVHCPMVIEKYLFVFAMEQSNWDTKAGYCMKSIYGNMMVDASIYYPDLKIRQQYPIHELHSMVKDRLWFSTDDSARDHTTETFLKQLYPNKSKWEI